MNGFYYNSKINKISSSFYMLKNVLYLKTSKIGSSKCYYQTCLPLIFWFCAYFRGKIFLIFLKITSLNNTNYTTTKMPMLFKNFRMSHEKIFSGHTGITRTHVREFCAKVLFIQLMNPVPNGVHFIPDSETTK